MSAAHDHDRRALGNPEIALPERDALPLGEAGQLPGDLVGQAGIGRMGNGLELDRGIDRHPFDIRGCQGSGFMSDAQALLGQGRQPHQRMANIDDLLQRRPE